MAQLDVVLHVVNERDARAQPRQRFPFQLQYAAEPFNRVRIGRPKQIRLGSSGRRRSHRRRSRGNGGLDLLRQEPLLVAVALKIVQPDQKAELAAAPEALRHRGIEAPVRCIVIVSAKTLAGDDSIGGHSDRGRASEIKSGRVERRARDQVQRAADRIAIDVGRPRLGHDRLADRTRGDRFHVELSV